MQKFRLKLIEVRSLSVNTSWRRWTKFTSKLEGKETFKNRYYLIIQSENDSYTLQHLQIRDDKSFLRWDLNTVFKLVHFSEQQCLALSFIQFQQAILHLWSFFLSSDYRCISQEWAETQGQSRKPIQLYGHHSWTLKILSHL